MNAFGLLIPKVFFCMNKVNIFLRHLKEKNICLSTNVPNHLKNSKLGLKLTITFKDYQITHITG